MGPLQDNAVSMYKDMIILGKRVSDFFKNRNVKTVSIILDYKHNSMILWGDSPDNNILIRTHSGLVGYKIYYARERYGTAQIRAYTKISASIGEYLTVLRKDYAAKQLNSMAVVIEDVKLIDALIIKARGITRYANMREQFIMLGDNRICIGMKPEDLVRKERKIQTNQATPIQTQTQTSRLPNTQSQITQKSRQLPTKIQEKQVESTPNIIDDMPTSEEIAKAEAEYKKMILGDD